MKVDDANPKLPSYKPVEPAKGSSMWTEQDWAEYRRWFPGWISGDYGPFVTESSPPAPLEQE